MSEDQHSIGWLDARCKALALTGTDDQSTKKNESSTDMREYD